MIIGPSGPTLEQLAAEEAKKPTIRKIEQPAAKPVIEKSEPEAAPAVIPSELVAVGITDIDDIRAMSDDELLAVPGIGPAKLDQIRAKIG